MSKFTRADLPRLRDVRAALLAPDDSIMARALDLAIEVAEADKPTLPDAEVLVYTDPDDGDQALYWQRDGMVADYRRPDSTLMYARTLDDPENYAPYLPPITDDQVEAAAKALTADEPRFWGVASEGHRELYRAYARDAFRAAGFPIEGDQ